MQIEVYLFIIVFIACFVQSMAGFGSALVALPLLLTVIPLESAVPMMALVGMSRQLLLLRHYWKNIDLRAVWRLCAASIVAIPCGLLVLSHVPRNISLPILGGIIIFYVLYSLLKFKVPRLENPRWAYLFGFMGGLLAGAYNTSGPPIVVYANARRWDILTFKANLQGYFFLNGIMTISSHALAGNFTPLILRNYLITIPAIIVGILLGVQMDRYINAELFRKMVLILLLVLGLRLAFS